MMKLSEIADVRLGVNARVRYTGEVQLVTNAAIQPFGVVDPGKVQNTDFNEQSKGRYKEHLLEDRDVLLVGKGKEHIAATWHPESRDERKTVPSSHDPSKAERGEQDEGDRVDNNGKVDQGKRALASSTLFVIRPKPGAGVPSTFLNAFLNSPTAQAYFEKHAKRGTVSVLGKEALENLVVHLPDGDKEMRVMTTFYQAQREYQITLAELQKAQETLTRGIVAGVIKTNK